MTAKVLCDEFMLFRGASNVANNVTLQLAFIEFAQEAKDSLGSKGMHESADYKKQFEKLKATFSDFTFEDIKLPEFKTQNPFDDANFKGYFEPGGGNSVYITIDLLKLFEEKKDKYDTYLSYGE